MSESRPYCEVATIILNLNGSSDTVACVDSILLDEGMCGPIVVLDNGSAETDYEELRLRLVRGVNLLRIDSNRGVAAGWNIAVKYARNLFNPRYVFLLNNDTVVERGLTRELLERASSLPNLGAAGPSIMRYEMPYRNQYLRLEGIRSPTMDFKLSGCALLVRSEVFDEIGYFDEDYFAYGEESDLLERMRKTHWVSYYVPTSCKVCHKGGGTASRISGFEAYHKTRNRLLFAGKNLRGFRLLGNVGGFFFKTLPLEVAGDIMSKDRRVRLAARIRGISEGCCSFIRARRVKKYRS